MRSSSGRRQMSYNQIEHRSDKVTQPSNRTFIKRGQSQTKKMNQSRVSYANARQNGNMQRYEKYVPSSRTQTSYSSANRSSNTTRSSSSTTRTGSSSSSRVAKSTSIKRSSGVSRSSSGGNYSRSSASSRPSSGSSSRNR
jgi:hypothetical protein